MVKMTSGVSSLRYLISLRVVPSASLGFSFRFRYVDFLYRSIREARDRGVSGRPFGLRIPITSNLDLINLAIEFVRFEKFFMST